MFFVVALLTFVRRQYINKICVTVIRNITQIAARTDHTVEENHVIDWNKAKVVDREA